MVRRKMSRIEPYLIFKKKSKHPYLFLGGDMHFGSLLVSACLACWFSFSLPPQRFFGQIYQICVRDKTPQEQPFNESDDSAASKVDNSCGKEDFDPNKEPNLDI